MSPKQFAIASVLACAAMAFGGSEAYENTIQVRGEGSDPSVRSLQTAFRRATARYHDTGNLAPDGWVQLQPNCFTEEFTEGTGETFTLGIVFVRPAHLDSVIDVNEPEVLYYEPQADGSLKLVGGEYFCPVDACPSAPTLNGQTFRLEEHEGGWALHVWAWLRNPNGLTHPVNPNFDATYCP